MKIIQPSFEVYTETNPIKKIERIARIYYKSEHRITNDSAKNMIRQLIDKGHWAMLEHADMLLEVDVNTYRRIRLDIDINNSFLKFKETMVLHTPRFTISGNLLAWMEQLVTPFCRDYYYIQDIWQCLEAYTDNTINKTLTWDLGIQYEKPTQKYFVKLIDPSSIQTLSHDQRFLYETLSVIFTVDQGIANELAHMRRCSFAQEPTCYCNYGHADEITVIQPSYLKPDTSQYNQWKTSCEVAEMAYMNILKNGGTPQEARCVLPMSTKADICVTATLEEWYHIFELRAIGTAGQPHPQMKEVMLPLLKHLINNGYDFAFGELLNEKERKTTITT